MDTAIVIMIFIGSGIIGLLYAILNELKTIRTWIIRWQLTWERRNGIDHVDVENELG